jgi:membrane-bound lytic murein transglycosylase A
VLRVGYAGSNGHPYSSVGQPLVARGALEPHELSWRGIKGLGASNPQDGAALLRTNASFVFFREVSEVPASRGPLGAMNRSVTALRSLAVDPRFVPLGAPVWIDEGGQRAHAPLMVAQDTGKRDQGRAAGGHLLRHRRAGGAAGRPGAGRRAHGRAAAHPASPMPPLPETVPARGRLPRSQPADPS